MVNASSVDVLNRSSWSTTFSRSIPNIAVVELVTIEDQHEASSMLLRELVDEPENFFDTEFVMLALNIIQNNDPVF